MLVQRWLTADELMAIPDDRKYELLRGELLSWPLAWMDHGHVSAEIILRVGNFVAERTLGLVLGPNTGFYFGRDPDTVLAPDGTFIRADRRPPRDERDDRDDYVSVVPDLVVEVVSCWDAPAHLDAKVAFYLASGVRLVWVADPPGELVTVHAAGAQPRVLQAGDVLDGGDVLPGFAVPIADLFDW